ncbi:unnamed protein product [Camellia sinensis]
MQKTNRKPLLQAVEKMKEGPLLLSSLEASVIPAFEMSCKAMFEQVDATFQKGMIEHATVAQQQFETRFEFGGLCFMTRWMDFSF